MNWLHWSLLSAFFAGLTAILAKVGVTGVDSNLATALRTAVILVFTWAIAFATAKPAAIWEFSGRTWLFLILSGMTKAKIHDSVTRRSEFRQALTFFSSSV